MKKKLSEIELHSAGATVRHQNPFTELVSYTNIEEITQDFREQWIIPFYFNLKDLSEEWIVKMIDMKPKISQQVVLQNLGDFNWRSRSTGSYFAAILGAHHLEDIIGTHLLKSEVCYAGNQYALTMAFFNTDKSIDYFNRYLDHYLQRPDLYFNQGTVLKAVSYLDGVNGTNNMGRHHANYESFLQEQGKIAKADLRNLRNNYTMDKVQIDKLIEETEIIDLTIDTSRFELLIKALDRIAQG